MSVLQCERPRQIKVCHVCSGKPDVFNGDGRKSIRTLRVHNREFTDNVNETQLDAHKSISWLPEVTQLVPSADEGIEILKRKYSSSQSNPFCWPC